MYRQAVARAARPIARRPVAGARGYASAAHDHAVAPYPIKEFEALGMKEIKDDRIAHGQHAFLWEIPKDLKPNDFIRRRRAVEEHAQSTTDLWRKITFYVCLPGCVATGIYVYKAEMAHKAHHQKLIDENGGVEPERKVYAFMNIRNKPFPWGNQSLFFNPKVNIPAPDQ